MAVAFLFADEVEHRPQRVGHAAGQDVGEAGPRHGGDGVAQADDHAPAHGEIADHGKAGVFFQVDGVEHDADGGADPFHRENRPGHGGADGEHSEQHDGSVGARDGHEDVAMVHHPHHLLGHPFRQTVVDAGNQEHEQYGRDIHNAA